MGIKRKINRKFEKEVKNILNDYLTDEVKNHAWGDKPMKEYIKAHNDLMKSIGIKEEDSPEMFFDENGQRKGNTEDED